MAITRLDISPDVGTVGKPSTAIPVGFADGTAVKYYVTAAPTGSRYATGSFLIETTPVGSGAFSPDKPGQYTVTARDVTATTPVPGYESAVIAPPTDNETTAPSVSASFWVTQTVSRDIGFGDDKIRVSLATYDDTVDRITTTAPVTLAPGSGPGSKIAVHAPSVRSVQSALSTYSGSLRARLSLDATTFRAWAETLSSHFAAVPNGVHMVMDASGINVAGTSTPAECAATIASIAAGLSAHAPNTVFHPAAVPISVNAAAASTRLSDVCAYWYHVYHALRDHATDGYAHNLTTTGSADGAFGVWAEAPTTLAELSAATGDLTVLFLNHKTTTTRPAAHSPNDTENIPVLIPLNHSADQFYGFVNAVADCINRHITDTLRDGTPAPSPWHNSVSSLRVKNRASSPATAAQTMEECILVMEAHAADTTVHASPALGQAALRGEWPFSLRLQRAYAYAVSSTSPVIPIHHNSAATAAITTGWT